MGILNVTPDSFSDGGKFYSTNDAFNHALKMIQDGADIIDIGGESTRPGADSLDDDEEMSRIIPVIQALRKESDILLSIDTYKSSVAEKAIEAGANIINDISGLCFDPKMVSLVADKNVPVVIMHIKGTPKTMQENPVYGDLIGELKAFFLKQIQLAKKNGVKQSQMILDPGIGFGKKYDDNFTILNQLNEICNLGYPVMIGPSRKSFIGQTLDLPPGDRVEGTAAAVSAGILNGARIVRVHDVKAMKRVVTITEKIRTAA
ncbi:MAG TPA: dihydropteroate synthase [Candidatus Marinimicrobia bacterium]|nr:dihydropteroate synthase [Candidatus Neomarinimicrobiota bacterium]HIB32819.1 dihydropteroate synthase [Candidatus Neomarinimicrobiota bacterium]